jgi:hypothetical protein
VATPAGTTISINNDNNNQNTNTNTQQTNAQAPQQNAKPEKKSKVDALFRFRAGVDVVLGVGSETEEVGTTYYYNNKVKLSAGGGFGLGFTLGFGVLPAIDIEGSFISQVSTLDPDVDDAEGNFSRVISTWTALYKIPISSKGQIKIGGGVGYYMNPELEIDADYGINEFGRARTIKVKYKDAVGTHQVIEYEHFTSKDSAFSIGLKTYQVEYELKSMDLNGLYFVADPNAELPKQNGNGTDLMFRFNHYF